MNYKESVFYRLILLSQSWLLLLKALKSKFKSKKVHVTLCWPRPPPPLECHVLFEWPLMDALEKKNVFSAKCFLNNFFVTIEVFHNLVCLKPNLKVDITLNVRDHSNNTWHPRGGGKTKCHMSFFAVLNSDFKASDSKSYL